jgi:hypothetical protein
VSLLFINIRVTRYRMRWEGCIARMADIVNSYTILVGKPERKRFLERSLLEYEDNIKMYLKDITMGLCELDSSGSG